MDSDSGQPDQTNEREPEPPPPPPVVQPAESEARAAERQPQASPSVELPREVKLVLNWPPGLLHTKPWWEPYVQALIAFAAVVGLGISIRSLQISNTAVEQNR